jgi:putative oxidoreductase
VESFTGYGLPAPEVFVSVIGVVELTGGLLFLAGLLTRPAALMIAGNMVGAIVTSGILKGETISLTLAPALFLSACFLLWAGGGARSVDAVLARRAVGPDAVPPGSGDRAREPL